MVFRKFLGNFAREFFILTLLIGLPRAEAGKSLPFHQDHIEALEKRYFSRGQVDLEKVAQVRHEVQARREGVFSDLVNHYRFEKRLAEDKARNKASERKEVWVFDYIDLIKLKELEEAKDYPTAMRRAHETEILIDATRNQGLGPLLSETAKEIASALRTHKAKKQTQAEEEASNLYDSQSKTFLDLKEVANKLQSNDTQDDLSLLNPDPQSPYWQDPGDIAAIDIAKLYLGDSAPMFRGIRNVFPQDNRAIFDEVRQTQTHPKMDLHFYDENEQKQALKIKFGPEVHAQPTVSALAMALGFHTDLVKHAKNFKVDLDGRPASQIMMEWNGYFVPKKPGRDFSIHPFINQQASSEEALVFIESALTARPKELIRVGGWSFGDYSQDDFREVRGMNLFNMWVSNSDAKHFGNNKVVLKKRENEKGFEIFQYQHDLGHSFGPIRSEKINALPWMLVSENNEDAVEFTYVTTKVHTVQDKMTYADARWMARLIAQLTIKQIEDAVSLGGWQDYAAKLVAAKLISRRNDMVEAFGLTGEIVHGRRIELYPVDTSITLVGGQLKDGEIIYCDDPSATVDYCHYTRDLLAPYGAVIKRAFAALGRGIMDLVDKFDVTGEEIGVDSALIASVIYSPKRQIRKNTQPTGPHDLYLVMDSYRIGFRLGGGIVATGDVTLWKEYTLVYPAANQDQAIFSRSFFLDLLMPFRLALKNLPENFVLIREDYVAGRGRLRANVINLGPNTDLTLSKIFLDRSFVVKNNPNDIILYEDTSVSTKLAWRIYLGLLLLKLPLVKVENEWGSINGKGYLIDQTDLLNSLESDGTSEALMLAVNEGDYGDLKKLVDSDKVKAVKELDVTSFFEAPKAMFSLFGLIGADTESHAQRLHLEVFDHRDASMWKRDELQIQTRKRFQKMLEGGETHEVNIQGFSGIRFDNQGEERADQPVIKLNLSVEDGIATSEEMDQGYAPFLNQLAEPGKKMVYEKSFTEANRGGSEGSWNGIQLQVEQYYYVDALEKMLALVKDEHLFWQAMNQHFLDYQASPVTEDDRYSAESAGKDLLDHIRNAVQGRSQAKQIKRAMVKKRNSAVEYHMDELVKGIRSAVYREGHTYVGHTLASLNRYLGFDNIFVRTRLAPQDGNENIFPNGGRDYVGEAGKQQAFEYLFYILNGDKEAIQIYNSFDWLR